jgi:cysteine desulfurase
MSVANAPSPFPVYLDYAATTPVDRRVAERMIPFLTEVFGNPASSTHAFGWSAREAVEQARSQVAKLIGAQPGEIIWTSGATEGNNLAIKGAAHANRRGTAGHLITVATEHKAVLDTVKDLEREGFSATVLRPGADGLVSAADVEAAIRPDTVLVSVMLVNNEIGVIQPIAQIGAVCRAQGVIFHCDAVQGAGKVAIDVDALQVDLLTITAHKMYGPKGIGALYVRQRPRVAVEAQIHGGGHERGMRSGTLPAHQIVGFGEAARIAALDMASDNARIGQLRDQLLDGLRVIDGLVVNGSLESRVPHNLNVSIPLGEGASLAMSLDRIAVSAGSACTSAAAEPSHVLRAIGLPDELAHHSLRISIGRYTEPADIEVAIEAIRASAELARATA